MIIRDEDVQAALDWLNQQPHPTPVAQYKLTEAENGKEDIEAELHFKCPEGTVQDKKMWVILQPKYKAAREAVALAERDLGEMKKQDAWAETVSRMYQTVSANTRYAERIR